jgi:hypothetical protein
MFEIAVADREQLGARAGTVQGKLGSAALIFVRCTV